METDVIVIGAGLAGHCAALEAAEFGAQVLLLERQGAVGGSSVLSGGSFAFAGSDHQIRAGITDSAERLTADLFAVGGNANDPSLVAVYVEHQLAAYRWLVARDVQFGPVQAASGQSVPRQHPSNPREVVRILNEEIAGNPKITTLLNTRALRLRRNAASGRVTGVLVEQEDGERMLSARGGVVLTAGGFSRNAEMVEQFAPSQGLAKRVGGAGSQGEGIKMAMQLGAGLRDMGYIKGTFGNHPAAHAEQHTAMLAVYKGAIAVNKAGRRFADESISYKLIGDACLQQPDAAGFQIFDQGIMDTGVPEVPIFNFARRLAEGLLHTAPTLAALAEKVGIDPATLAQTIETYNRDVAAGHDSAFGRSALVQGFGALREIVQPPFYAYPSTSAVIATYCGITVDPSMRVLDVFGDVIPGLYAAGEMTGGFHGKAFMTGSSLGKCVICGRLAGQNAAVPVNA